MLAAGLKIGKSLAEPDLLDQAVAAIAAMKVLGADVSVYHIPVCIHQDHGAPPGICARSILSGFSSVMRDGSLREDSQVAEGRLDHTALLACPDEAADFVVKAQVDALAIPNQ